MKGFTFTIGLILTPCAVLAAPATQLTTKPSTQPTGQPKEIMVPIALLREANDKIAELQDKLREAYQQINDLQQQLATLQGQQGAAAPPLGPAPAAPVAKAGDSAGLGATLVTVDKSPIRVGMTVDQVTAALARDRQTGLHEGKWDPPMQIERTGDETVYRWKKWGMSKGDKYHTEQRIVTAQIIATFKGGRLVGCKWQDLN